MSLGQRSEQVCVLRSPAPPGTQLCARILAPRGLASQPQRRRHGYFAADEVPVVQEALRPERFLQHRVPQPCGAFWDAVFQVTRGRCPSREEVCPHCPGLMWGRRRPGGAAQCPQPSWGRLEAGEHTVTRLQCHSGL